MQFLAEYSETPIQTTLHMNYILISELRNL